MELKVPTTLKTQQPQTKKPQQKSSLCLTIGPGKGKTRKPKKKKKSNICILRVPEGEEFGTEKYLSE